MQNNTDSALLNALPRPTIVFSDFDGTLTDHTEFSRVFFDILSTLTDHAIPLVIVTGRSISWAHFLLTHFQHITHVIAEGGGVHAYREDRGYIQQMPLIDSETINRLRRITSQLTTAIPAITLSADSLGRLTDRAIELEDLEADPQLMSQVTTLLDAEGANYSTSNVHLNFWCGDIDKYSAMQYFLEKYHPTTSLEDCIFFGDSLNDQSVFQHMQHTIGVANIAQVAERLTHKPKVILTGANQSGPQGVAYVIDTLLQQANSHT